MGFFFLFLVLQTFSSGIPPARAEAPLRAHWDSFEGEGFPVLTGVLSVQRGSLPLRDVQAGRFRLLEDGVEQQPLEVTPLRTGLSVALLIDSSGSMRESLSDSLDAVAGFLDHLGPGDRAALFDFDDAVRVLCPLTADRVRLRAALRQPRPDGGTALYDSLLAVLAHLEGAPGRRAVVLLTDGADQDAQGRGAGSRADLSEVLVSVKHSGVPVYAVGLGMAVDRRVLVRIAEASGGQAAFAADSREVKVLYERLASQLPWRYAVRYRSKRPFRDGTLRHVRLEVWEEGEHAEALARYVAGAEGSAAKALVPPVVPEVPREPPLERIPRTLTEEPRPTPVDLRLVIRRDGRDLSSRSLGEVELAVPGETVRYDEGHLEAWPGGGEPGAAVGEGNRVYLSPGTYRFSWISPRDGRRWSSVFTVEPGARSRVALRRLDPSVR